MIILRSVRAYLASPDKGRCLVALVGDHELDLAAAQFNLWELRSGHDEVDPLRCY